MKDYILKRTDWHLAPRAARRYDGSRQYETRVREDSEFGEVRAGLAEFGYEVREGAVGKRPAAAIFQNGRRIYLCTSPTADGAQLGVKMFLGRVRGNRAHVPYAARAASMHLREAHAR